MHQSVPQCGETRIAAISPGAIRSTNPGAAGPMRPGRWVSFVPPGYVEPMPTEGVLTELSHWREIATDFFGFAGPYNQKRPHARVGAGQVLRFPCGCRGPPARSRVGGPPGCRRTSSPLGGTLVDVALVSFCRWSSQRAPREPLITMGGRRSYASQWPPGWDRMHAAVPKTIRGSYPVDSRHVAFPAGSGRILGIPPPPSRSAALPGGMRSAQDPPRWRLTHGWSTRTMISTSTRFFRPYSASG